jgi:hypothetical protein
VPEELLLFYPFISKVVQTRLTLLIQFDLNWIGVSGPQVVGHGLELQAQVCVLDRVTGCTQIQVAGTSSASWD